MTTESTTETRKDTRIAYGATCTWWDSIYNVGQIPGGLPACPHCKGVLFEMPDEAAFFKGADDYERSGHPGYRKVVEWMRGRCFPTLNAAQAAFDVAQSDAGATS